MQAVYGPAAGKSNRLFGWGPLLRPIGGGLDIAPQQYRPHL